MPLHRLALLGCGDVAVRDYLPELHRLAGRVELVAVSSRGEARARAVAERYGARAWYTDYQRMLEDCDADIVANLTPIQVHHETNLAALRSGRHIYSEKPLASTVAEARTIAEEADRRGLTLVCAPCVMVFPQVQRAQALLEAGTIGAIYSARGQGHGGVPPWRGYTSDPSPFFAAGSGPAFDMGVYPLHAITGLLGPVRRVMAMTGRTRDHFVAGDGPAAGARIPIEVEDNWHLVLDLSNGRIASLETSNCVQATRAPQLELMGLRGTIAVNLIDVAAPLALLRAGNDWEEIQVPHQRAGGPDHVLGIEHLVDCLDAGTQPTLGAAHAVHVIEIIERAAQSAREGRALPVSSSFSPTDQGA